MPVSPVKSILFITPSSIGDIILTTPTLEALHLLWPEAVMDFVGSEHNQEIFRHCPYAGDFFVRNKKEGLSGRLRLIRRLRLKQYDLGVDLRTDGLLWLLRVKQRMHKIPGRAHHYLHSVEKHFLTIAKLAKGMPIPQTKIWLSDTERDHAEKILSDLEGKRILAMAPGAAAEDKDWSPQNFSALANQLKTHFDAVLLLGSAQNQPLAQAVAALLELPCLDLCGRTDLLLAAALLQRAQAFVGNDSGLGHIASAVGTPAVTVFGAGELWRYRPWGTRTAWVKAEHHDIAGVTPQQVKDILLKLLEGQS